MSNSSTFDTEKWLAELNSSEAWKRKAAAETLGESNVSDETIVAKLAELAASDTNKYVRAAAAKALPTDANRASLAQHPTLGEDATPVVNEVAQAGVSSPAQPPAARAASIDSGLSSWGIYMIIAGVVACALPFFGYKLMLLRVIDTENPLWGIALIVGGTILYFVTRNS